VPILHSVAQRSEAWDRLKLGIPSSSEFHRILTPGGKDSEQWEQYACALIAERLLGRKLDSYVSPWMERGAELEIDAVRWYELDRDLDTEVIGFVTTGDGKVGCSPDRLVGDDGLLEIKAPAPATQVQYLITGAIDRKYKPQLQGQLWITERQWVDILAWHEELPRAVIRVERDEKYIERLAARLDWFVDYVDACLAKIETVSTKASLRERLQASLQVAP
jgi:hypothetical protein